MSKSTLLGLLLICGCIYYMIYDITVIKRDYTICYENNIAVFVGTYKPDPLFMKNLDSCEEVKITRDRASQIGYSIRKGK